MALVTEPTIVHDLDVFETAIQYGINSGQRTLDLGETTRPEGTVLPDFDIVVTKVFRAKTPRWTVAIRKTREPAQGTNQSFSLGAGEYPTGYTFSHGGFGLVQTPNDAEVWRVVSPHIADLSLQAETEHCQDIILAHELTVGAAARVIDNVTEMLASNLDVYNSPEKAMTVAKDMLVSQSPHVVLEQLFQDAISTGFDKPGFQLALCKLHLLAARLTKQRDEDGWHFFNIDKTAQSWKSVDSWRESLRGVPLVGASGPKKDVRDVVCSGTFQVPGPPSRTVIDLDILTRPLPAFLMS